MKSALIACRGFSYAYLDSLLLGMLEKGFTEAKAGFVRVNTADSALLFNFVGGQRTVEFVEPLCKSSGSRFSIFLREVDFEPCTRDEIDSFILKAISTYE